MNPEIRDATGRIPTLRALATSYFTASGKQAARNLAWLISWTGLSSLSNIAGLIVLTSGLGAERYGLLAFGLSLQMYLQLVGGLGLRQVVVREGVRHPGRFDEIIGTYIALSASGGLATFVLTSAVLSSLTIDPIERSLLLLLAGGNAFACINWQPIFDLRHRQPYGAAPQALGDLLALCGWLFLHRLGSLGLSSAAGVLVVKWALISAGQWLLARRAFGPFRFAWSPSLGRALLTAAWPLLLSGLVATIPLGAGIFFLRAWGDSRELAILGVAQQIALAVLLFGGLCVRILDPHIAGPHGFKRSFVGKLALFAATYVGVLAAGGWAGTVLVARFLLEPVFAPLPGLEAALIVGISLALVATVAASYLIVLRRERTILAVNSTTSAIFILGCWLLVPSFSYYGVAVSTVICYFVATMLLTLHLRSAFPRERTA